MHGQQNIKINLYVRVQYFFPYVLANKEIMKKIGIVTLN